MDRVDWIDGIANFIIPFSEFQNILLVYEMAFINLNEISSTFLIVGKIWK